MSLPGQFFIINFAITIDKKLNFEQRCRQFRKNFTTTVQYLLNVLLLMTIIINGSGKSS